jgi:hypothetical protein
MGDWDDITALHAAKEDPSVRKPPIFFPACTEFKTRKHTQAPWLEKLDTNRTQKLEIRGPTGITVVFKK